MNSFKPIAFGAVVLALVVPLCIHLSEAQKTIANSFQQQFSGSNPNSVYGGYQTSSVNQQRQVSLVAPVNQRRTQQTYVNRQQSEVRQPVYQQSISSSSYEQTQDQAEADAEPASYGKSPHYLLSRIDSSQAT